MRRPGARRRSEHGPPPSAVAAAITGGSDRMLAAGRIGSGEGWLLATAHGLAEVAADGQLNWRRAWHEVDEASWSRQAGALTVTWVNRPRPQQWELAGERAFLQAVRERVQASVVVVEEVMLPGRRVARAVIRQDLGTRGLVEQLVLRRAGRLDEQDEAAIAQAFDRLREETGMPPRQG